MAPIRGNKNKQKAELNESESSGADQTVEFSKLIAARVSPSKALDNFQTLFKVSRKTFNYICSIVWEPMTSRVTNFVFVDGKSMSLNDQVAVALRRLNSGHSLTTVADFFGTSPSTVSRITWLFVDALKERGHQHLQWPSEMGRIKSGFESIRGLPNCCGAIETTHLKMFLHPSEGETNVWVDQANNHSMTMQVIVDPKMRFCDVVAGWPGQMNNVAVLQKSTFFDLVQEGARLNGDKIKLSQGTEVREYIVGGSGFQLLPWLITPYQDEKLSKAKSEFNQRHLATRVVAGRALKRFKEVWGVIGGVMWKPDKNKLPRVIIACCILHNIIIDIEGVELPDESTVSCEHDPGYPPEVCALEDNNAAFMRDKLSLYLAGRLPA